MLQSEEASEKEREETGLYHRLYRPPTSPTDHGVVLVHGRAGNASVMWTFTKAFERFKPLTVAPQGTIPDLDGFSWWQIEDPADAKARGIPTGLEKLSIAIEQVERFVLSLPQVYNVDPSRILGIGFSQGGGLLSALSLRNPTLFRGVAILSGFLPRVVAESEHYINERLRKKELCLPDIFIAHGSEDKVLPLEKAEFARATLERFGAQIQFHEEKVGHKLGAAGMKALGEWCSRLFT